MAEKKAAAPAPEPLAPGEEVDIDVILVAVDPNESDEELKFRENISVG